MADKTKIEIAVEALNKAKTVLQDAGNDVTKLEQKTTASLESMKTKWVEAAAKITATIYAIKKAWDMADVAAGFQEQKDGLNVLASEYGTSADTIIKKLKEVSNGQLSMKESVDVAAKAILTGVDPDSLYKLVDGAELLSDVVGGTLADNLDRMSFAISTGNERTLKLTRLNVDFNKAYEDMARKVGVAKDRLTEEELVAARIIAVIDALTQKTIQFGKAQQSISDSMAEFTANLSDMGLFIGQLVTRVGAFIMGTFQGVVSGLSLIYETGTKLLLGWYKMMDSLQKNLPDYDPGPNQKKIDFLQKSIDTFSAAGANAAAQWVNSWDVAFKSWDKKVQGTQKNPPGPRPEDLEAAKKKMEELAKLTESINDEIRLLQTDEEDRELEQENIKHEKILEGIKKLGNQKAAIEQEMLRHTLSVQEVEKKQSEKYTEEAVKDLQGKAQAAEDSYDKQIDSLNRFIASQKALIEFDKDLSSVTLNELDKRLQAVDEWVEKEEKLLADAGEDETLNLDEVERRKTQLQQAAQDQRLQISKQYYDEVKAAELAYQSALADTSFKNKDISETNYLEQKIKLTQQLITEQEKHLTLISKEQDFKGYYEQKQQIDELKSSLKELNDQLQIQTGSLGEGFREGLNEWLEEVDTTFEAGKDLAKDTADAFHDAFSDGFFKLMRGEFDTLGDVVNSFLDGIARSVADKLSDMFTSGILDALLGALKGGLTGGTSAGSTSAGTGSYTLPDMGYVGHTGGLIMHSGGEIPSYRVSVNPKYLPKMHKGGPLASDERIIIGQTGEGIVSRNGMSLLDRINSGILGAMGNEDFLEKLASRFEFKIINLNDTDKANTEWAQSRKGSRTILNIVQSQKA